ncbi:hypothetical protein, partial [Streptomyces sp. H39-S7]|uniref:hypothetical protein n=1 Tax=Streptomyces sp. H39-S7 TaxID=3004357 RepID=UPI0022AFBF06
MLKVATATQILNLVRPHLSDNKVMRNALLVLQAKGEVVSEGNTAGPAGRFGAPDRTGEPSQKLWSLTPAGLDAAGRLLERDPQELGGRARGAAGPRTRWLSTPPSSPSPRAASAPSPLGAPRSP